MKIVEVTVANLISLMSTVDARTNAHGLRSVGDHGFAERMLILGGDFVPSGTKTYTVGLRSEENGINWCGGALISPKHVLYSSHDDAAFTNDFMVLELETPSSFKPVRLAAADDSDIKAGDPATVTGWGSSTENGTNSNELKRVDMKLWGMESAP